MRYGLILLEAIGILRHNGCLASPNLQEFLQWKGFLCVM